MRWSVWQNKWFKASCSCGKMANTAPQQVIPPQACSSSVLLGSGPQWRSFNLLTWVIHISGFLTLAQVNDSSTAPAHLLTINSWQKAWTSCHLPRMLCSPVKSCGWKCLVQFFGGEKYSQASLSLFSFNQVQHFIDSSERYFIKQQARASSRALSAGTLSAAALAERSLQPSLHCLCHLFCLLWEGPRVIFVINKRNQKSS